MASNSRSLRTRLLTLGILFPAIIVAILFVFYYIQSKQKTSNSFEAQARAILMTAESARLNMEEKWHVGAFDSDQLIEWSKEGRDGQKKILEAVPVYSALQAAGMQAEKGGYTFKAPIYQESLRNPSNEATPLDIKALDKLRNDVSGNSANPAEWVHLNTDTNNLHYYRAVYLGETCLYCHGVAGSEYDIWGNNGIDGTGHKMDGKQLGDMHGAFLIEMNLDQADAQLANYMSMAGIGILIALIVGGLVFAFVIVRSVEKPIAQLASNLGEGASQVSSASSQVSGASQSMAQGASEQAASLEETSSALEELSSMTRQNADNAAQADAMTRDVEQAANQSRQSLEKMSAAIEKIKDGADQTARIIKTIDEIAFQTNLLALNAAVEAARAGEAGKGFAVVAEEVRSLAQRSAEAARSTAELISESQENAENGVLVSAEVAEVLSRIIEGVGTVTRLVGEVSTATQEQSRGIEQINQGVNQLDAVTQNNAASAEESASVSEELNAQAEELHNMVAGLITLVKGGSAGYQEKMTPRITHD